MHGVIIAAVGYIAGVGVLALFKRVRLESRRRRWIPRILVRVPLPVRQYRSALFVRELRSGDGTPAKYRPSLAITQRTMGRWFDKDPNNNYHHMEKLLAGPHSPDKYSEWVSDFVKEKVMVRDLQAGDMIGDPYSNDVVTNIEEVNYDHYRVTCNGNSVNTWPGDRVTRRVRGVSRLPQPS